MKLVFFCLLFFILTIRIIAAQSDPGPEIFAKGIISTELDEYAPTFTPDGETIYFTLRAPGTSSPALTTIFFSRFVSGKWTTPQVATFSGRYRDTRPSISPDGLRLYFGSNRPLDGSGKAKNDFDLWVVERKESGWSEPRNLGAPINTDTNEYCASEASDGTLYFSSAKPGGKGTFDLYRSHPENGKYATTESIGETINTSAPELDLFIAPDQSYLIFTSIGRDDEIHGVHHPDYDQGDLYISFRENGNWTTAKNLGSSVNSGAADYTPFVSRDGRWLYFSSERGFTTETPIPRRLNYAEFVKGFSSILNGRGNIYRISTGVFVPAPSRRQASTNAGEPTALQRKADYAASSEKQIRQSVQKLATALKRLHRRKKERNR